ncbi:hypothetical protein B1A87_017860 [Arthrobacter sp. KBS0703]|uniref:hypothetical protein n=1 Tax=Arthrobacter sp. KBS0703 TaxID=1955698 RepID=UPI001117A43A|nr:hypothetical protein [Arthrobacter sp. KBS0703]TSE17379.1 hypothetical protein B1A87_017860 [Arthrobacter sp. KBS0703]
MANIRWDLVPNPEWVRMYRRGLSRGQISDQTGAPISTVGYHLTAARTADPALREEHFAAANGDPARATRRSVERMNELVGMVRQTGRYPATNAPDASERNLAAWLRRRRRDAAAGSLTRIIDDGLSVLPDWKTPKRAGRSDAGLTAARRR